MRLELAADYLVMAAWLAYLKSRLLLPEPAAPEGQSAADLAKALALRLRRLEAIRARVPEAVRTAAARPRRVRARQPRTDRRDQAAAMVGDALRPDVALMRPSASATRGGACVSPGAAYGRLRRRAPSWNGWSAATGDWGRLDDFLLAYLVEPSMRATVFASSLAATLELVREGAMEVHQAAAFAPIYLRRRAVAAPSRAGSITMSSIADGSRERAMAGRSC